MIGRVWLVAASSALTCGALGSGDHSTSTCSLKSFFFSLGKSGQKYQNKFSCFSWRPAIIISTTKKKYIFHWKKIDQTARTFVYPIGWKIGKYTKQVHAARPTIFEYWKSGVFCLLFSSAADTFVCLTLQTAFPHDRTIALNFKWFQVEYFSIFGGDDRATHFSPGSGLMTDIKTRSHDTATILSGKLFSAYINRPPRASLSLN